MWANVLGITDTEKIELGIHTGIFKNSAPVLGRPSAMKPMAALQLTADMPGWEAGIRTSVMNFNFKNDTFIMGADEGLNYTIAKTAIVPALIINKTFRIQHTRLYIGVNGGYAIGLNSGHYHEVPGAEKGNQNGLCYGGQAGVLFPLSKRVSLGGEFCYDFYRMKEPKSKVRSHFTGYSATAGLRIDLM